MALRVTKTTALSVKDKYPIRDRIIDILSRLAGLVVSRDTTCDTIWLWWQVWQPNLRVVMVVFCDKNSDGYGYDVEGGLLASTSPSRFSVAWCSTQQRTAVGNVHL